MSGRRRYSVKPAEGWYRDPDSGAGVRDRHFRIDVDLPVTPSVTESLRKWNNILEFRFDQRAIYMKISQSHSGRNPSRSRLHESDHAMHAGRLGDRFHFENNESRS
jgi:hypothetical protein